MYRPGLFCFSFFVLGLIAASAWGANVGAGVIIERSVQALQQDWQAAPEYDNFERDVEDHGTKTYQVLMILGSPYRRLVSVNGMALSAADQLKEQQRLEKVVSDRCGESQSQKQQRIREYEKNRERDHQMIQELTKAFEFRLAGRQTLAGHLTWLLQATPRPGYQPTNDETKALTGMRGKLWIDQATFQWVKVEAWVIHPVSIEGFLAKVEPGTRFELTKTPVSNGIWLPAQFTARSKAEVLAFIEHHSYDNETFYNYQKTSLVKIPACPAKSAAGGAH